MVITFTEAIQQAIEKEIPCVMYNDDYINCKIVSLDKEYKMLGTLDEHGSNVFISIHNINAIVFNNDENGQIKSIEISLPVKPSPVDKQPN